MGRVAPKGAIGTSTVQGVFHRLMDLGRGSTGPGGDEEMATFACAAGLREGRWDGLRTLSPQVGRVGFPSFRFLLWVS